MKKIILCCIILLPILGNAQTVLNRLKQKVKDRVERHTDEGMEKGLDETENQIKKGATKKVRSKDQETGANTSTNESARNDRNTSVDTFESYSHFDFIPGEKIVYAEDFSQDIVGEFPLKWSTNNHGQTVTIKGQQGNWMRIFKDGHFVSPYIRSMPENFTVEFDAIIHLPENVDNTSYPDLKVRLMNVPAGDEKARQFFNNYFDSKADIQFTIQPYNDDHSVIALESTMGGNKNGYFTSENKPMPKFQHYLDKPIHFAIWIQKERFRLWINGEKIYDLPQAVPANAAFNRMEFETTSSSYSDESIGYYFTNIRFAQGSADLRSKLLTEGKLVTNGILFDVNSDRIKPESSGVLQGIATVLKESPAVKVKIIGHTDSDGEVSANQSLSEKRAAAVKQALSSQFGIDASRMTTDGKGETQPVADNSTKEGKAQNRRVEFIKQ
jgi:OOP family OmpA-OmpF porin